MEVNLMNDLANWLSGRKTYLGAAALFTLALAALTNGWGDAEINTYAGVIAAITASLRAGVNKTATAKLALPLAAACLLFVGCASLGKVDPETGTSPAQDIVTATSDFSMVLPPPFNTIAPVGVGSILTLLIALGRAKDEQQEPTS